jgi:hypothetical protein
MQPYVDPTRKMTSKKIMEDDLKKNKKWRTTSTKNDNGRLPHFFFKEYDLNKNGRQPKTNKPEDDLNYFF